MPLEVAPAGGQGGRSHGNGRGSKHIEGVMSSTPEAATTQNGNGGASSTQTPSHHRLDNEAATNATSPSFAADERPADPAPYDIGQPKPVQSTRRGSTVLLTEGSGDVKELLQPLSVEEDGSAPTLSPALDLDLDAALDKGGVTRLAQKVCCGGGCCEIKRLKSGDEGATGADAHAVVAAPPPASTSTAAPASPTHPPIDTPRDNPAFDALNLVLGHLSLASELTDLAPLPANTVSFSAAPADLAGATADADLGPDDMPPAFVEPHSPYKVFRAPLVAARALTRPGAEKRTYHFEVDVTDYPAEGGGVDFVVGGAVGVCPANPAEVVDGVLDRLGVPRRLRDQRVTLRTAGGRWPTIWGAEQPRALLTTRRQLLRWCADLLSAPPTKPLLRLLAEHAAHPAERKILLFLCSAQGQGAFCDLRTATCTTVPQLLHAFPSSMPPLDHLLAVCGTLMPRFYSLSHDPVMLPGPAAADVTSSAGAGDAAPRSRRCIEFAVTVHDCPHYLRGHRTGVASGFLQSLAHRAMHLEGKTEAPQLCIPLFRGLMANPLAKEFTHDGPMLLIGAGVGIAPFRGFVQRRLRSATCANKVWVLQGIRDAHLDELYAGEWGSHEGEIKRVVQSRAGEGRYVQEEVRTQADLVWFVINSLDGKIYICGSSKGMGEGVERALVDVAVMKGLNRQSAIEFWEAKKASGQRHGDGRRATDSASDFPTRQSSVSYCYCYWPLYTILEETLESSCAIRPIWPAASTSTLPWPPDSPRKRPSQSQWSGKAILDLKTQRDKLHQYQKRIVRLTDRETAVARACVAAGDKPRARLALRRKKYQQSLLAQTDAQLAQLEQLVHGVEFALVQQSVLHGLRQGNEVLRAIHREIGGLEGVEKLMGETEEARQYQEVGAHTYTGIYAFRARYLLTCAAFRGYRKSARCSPGRCRRRTRTRCWTSWRRWSGRRERRRGQERTRLHCLACRVRRRRSRR
ncbi:hypothetical protein KEM52_000412 [Ascosphaera acerosa]|nr:hypothetical protein KEM52_000412 [Ascosphaera acerosa]